MRQGRELYFWVQDRVLVLSDKHGPLHEAKFRGWPGTSTVAHAARKLKRGGQAR